MLTAAAAADADDAPVVVAADVADAVAEAPAETAAATADKAVADAAPLPLPESPSHESGLGGKSA